MKHPEWRVLVDSVKPLIDDGKTEYTYDELKELGGIDVRTRSGRSQFLRFRRYALESWSLWFENVLNQGYRIVKAGEHCDSAVKRTKQAYRKSKLAMSILQNARHESMTKSEQQQNLASQAIVGALLLAHKDATPKLRKIQGGLVLPEVNQISH